MTIPTPPSRRPASLHSDPPQAPWGNGNAGDDGSGAGPRNPWSIPPSGKRGPARPSALDEFLKRARGGGGGDSGAPGGGLPRFPRGSEARSLWLIGAGLIVLLWIVLTSFHPIGPQQRGVVSTLGRFSGVLDSGIRTTLPAPFETVQKVDVQAIRTEDFPQDGGQNLMLTGDQNIVDLAYSVRWDIINPQDYVFQIADPPGTVRATAESAMRAVIATVTLDQALGEGRSAIEARVQDAMQRILDGYHSGVRIEGVAIKQADPPEKVVDDFKAVSAAQQQAQSSLNQARTYAQQVIARAGGEAAAFDKVYAQYKLAPEVTRRRMYYETMEDVLAHSDKTIIEAPGVVPYLPIPSARPKPLPDAPAAEAQP